MGILAKQSLYVKMKKCEFEKSVIGYLGHVISKEVVKVNNDKIKAMLN